MVDKVSTPTNRMDTFWICYGLGLGFSGMAGSAYCTAETLDNYEKGHYRTVFADVIFAPFAGATGGMLLFAGAPIILPVYLVKQLTKPINR